MDWILSDHWKHTFAVVAAGLAILLSLGQAINAFIKSYKHKGLHNKLPKGKAGSTSEEGEAGSTSEEGEAGSTSEEVSRWEEVLADDVKHFYRVGLLWLLGFLGAAATCIAEIIDWNLPP